MQDYQTLIAEHDHMDALAMRLIEIGRGEKDSTVALSTRAALSIALDDHLSKEDSFLYDELLGARDHVYPAAVLEFRRSFADLAGDWSDYLRSWDFDCVEADWVSFADETVVIMHRLRARIAAENNLLYPLALKGAHIRLRAAA